MLGLWLLMLAVVCLYLGSAQQQGLRRPWPRRPALGLAALAALVGALMLGSTRQALVTVYTVATLWMLVLALLPYLGLACRRLRGEGA